MTTDNLPSYDDLIAFASDELDGEAAQRVQRHIERVPDAAATVSRFRIVLNRMQAAHYPDPPPSLIAKAKRAFRDANTGSGVSGPSLFDKLGVVIAHLAYDSRLQPLAVRDRGGGDVVQLTYEAPGFEVDLRAERKSGSTADSTWEVMGQFSSEGESVDSLEIVAMDARTNRIIARSPLDETYMFSLDLPDGWYDLSVRGTSDILILPELLLE